jgi:hypothetical protein
MSGTAATEARKSLRIRFDDDIVRRLDAWRAEQRPIPSVAEACRQLIARGLAGEQHA